MIQRYKDVSIIYGGSGRRYAEALNDKLIKISTEERYPIQATIINEKILTCELLSDVMRLFKESEFCVTFLTKEDCCMVGNIEKKRLRQNVVFEVGMALIELGRERCILLSDFDVHDIDFELPSDMNSLEILPFDATNLDEVLDDVVDKLLKLSLKSVVTGVELEAIPKYDHLLIRNDYWVDYENIFVERPITLASEGKDFFNDTLAYWITECKSLPHYDEKCIYLLERIGFLPIFGKIPASVDFMEQAEELTESYYPSDIKYYGDAKLLDFTKNLVQCVIDYTILKTKDTNALGRVRKYKSLLQNMLSESVPDCEQVNPLIMVAYYDYLGLTYLRIYRAESNENDLQKAREAFLSALKFVTSVDLSMQIWSGFLNYNLARVFSELGDSDKAEKYYKKAIKIRNRWLKTSSYNVTVRNALSFEYFIAKIDYIDMCHKFGLMSSDEVQTEYSYVEKELNAYSDIDDKLDQLIYIRQLLKDRKKSE